MKKCFTPVDLSVATADLVNIFRSAIQNAGLSFTINCPPLGEMVYPSLLTPSLPFLHIFILLVFTSLCSCFFFFECRRYINTEMWEKIICNLMSNALKV